MKFWNKIKKKAVLKYTIIIAVIAVAIVAANSGLFGKRAQETTSQVRNLTSGGFDLDKEKAAVDLSDLNQGCPFKDCIPSIDNPNFESASEAGQYLDDQDLVFGINYKGTVRAYPQRILNWHEIVNDTIGDKPVVISFCPLCGTAIAHERILKGQPVEFGVSGKLLNSNLVMYDRLTETLWQHATGEAIVGELVGERLTQFPLETTVWGKWKEAHPQTEVLSRNTGFGRNYDAYPYGDYESSGRVSFPVQNEDDRLHPKAIGYGVEIGDQFKFYPEDKIGSSPITDKFAGKTLEIKRDKSGAVVIIDKNTGENINFLRGMWFSWVAFNPETELF